MFFEIFFFEKNKMGVAICKKVEYLRYRNCIQVFRTRAFQKGFFGAHFFTCSVE